MRRYSTRSFIRPLGLAGDELSRSIPDRHRLDFPCANLAPNRLDSAGAVMGRYPTYVLVGNFKMVASGSGSKGS